MGFQFFFLDHPTCPVGILLTSKRRCFRNKNNDLVPSEDKKVMKCLAKGGEGGRNLLLKILSCRRNCAAGVTDLRFSKDLSGGLHGKVSSFSSFVTNGCQGPCHWVDTGLELGGSVKRRNETFYFVFLCRF